MSANETDADGARDCGTDKETVIEEVPTTVFPLYVVQVRTSEPLEEFGISLAREVGGVHETEALLVLVTIVPVAVPNV